MIADHFMITGDSPEAIAYLLLMSIASNERKGVNSNGLIGGGDKKWLLDTYAECLLAVKCPQDRR